MIKVGQVRLTESPGYAIAYRIDQRRPKPNRQLSTRPVWTDYRGSSRKTSSGPNAQILLGFWGALMVRTAKDEFRAYLIDPTRLSGPLPPPSRKTSSELEHSEPAGNHATGVSPTRATLGTSARPPTAAAAAAIDGVVS